MDLVPGLLPEQEGFIVDILKACEANVKTRKTGNFYNRNTLYGPLPRTR